MEEKNSDPVKVEIVKKPWYKRWWGITIVVLVAILAIGSIVYQGREETKTTSTKTKETKPAASDSDTEEPKPVIDETTFISYTGEDRVLARKLAEALGQHGTKVSLDEFELQVGDSIRHKIDKGLGESKFGIVLVSQAFFDEGWAMSDAVIDPVDYLTADQEAQLVNAAHKYLRWNSAEGLKFELQDFRYVREPRGGWWATLKARAEGHEEAMVVMYMSPESGWHGVDMGTGVSLGDYPLPGPLKPKWW